MSVNETISVSIRVDGFDLLSEVGRGASARIFLAREQASGDKVCLKVFHPTVFQDRQSNSRIRREMELSVKLRHPNILSIRHAVLESDLPLMVMEYVPGKNLEKFQGSLPFVLPEVAVLIVIQILKALEYSHGRGVVHRDLKPENVLIRQDGQVFVADFGLAKWRDHSVTNTSGFLIGSVDYMSPEQVSGDLVGPASDIFSVAGILYFLVTGTRPFTRPSPTATLDAVKTQDPEVPQKRNPKVSNRLSQLIQRGMKKDPGERYRSAFEFRKELEQYLSDIGLGEETFNFIEWTADPSGVTLQALQASAEALGYRGQTALADKDWNAFIDVQSHLSLKAPESESLKRLSLSYRELRRKRQRRAGGWLVAAGLLVFLLAMAAVRWWPTPTTVPVIIAPAVPEIKLPEPVPTGTIVFDLPAGTSVSIDGKKVDPARPLTGQSLGKHRLRMVRKGFSPIEASIDVVAEKPTTIKVAP